MSEPLDPLEAELLGLQPHEASHGLRRRIGEQLVGDSSTPLPFDFSPTAGLWRLRQQSWRPALFGGLAAAFLLAVLVLRWEAGRRAGLDKADGSRPSPAPLVEDTGPTLRAYERALAQSPEALDALLDKDAALALETNPKPVPSGALRHSDTALQQLLGED